MASARPGHWARGAVVMPLLGATLGFALDAIHSHAGAIVYTDPVMFRAAWWVPLLFAGAFCIGLIRPLLDRILGDPRPARSLPMAALAMAFFAGAYFLSVAPLRWEVVTALLVGLFAVSWWICDRSPVGLAIALGAAIGGPLFESMLVSQGLFLHLHTVAIGVPGWLPALYLCAAVGLTSLAQWLVDG